MNVLRGADLRGLMPMREAVQLSKSVFAMLSTPGQTQVPERHILEFPAGRFTVMTGAAGGGQYMGAKLLTVFPGNVQRGLARINAMVAIMDAETGLVDTVLDGTWLTAFRTGAAVGASVDLLARRASATVAVFGAGLVGYMAILATASVRCVESVRIYDPDRARGRVLAEKLAADLGLSADRQVQCAADPAMAVAGADIVITATNAATALFPDRALSPGTHVAAMGGGYPHSELEPETVRRARVFVDSRELAARECGDILRAWGPLPVGELPVAGELGEVVLAQVPGRTSEDELSVFESSGSAVQDVVVGGELARRARAAGVGVEVACFHTHGL
jgi:ornithine cyclodeaminase/alanine dehydrogenase-like protein (mu-crystallin family)